MVEDLNGLEVSMCTSNSQQVSISQLLPFQCLGQLLKYFPWGDPDYQSEYLLTLEDTTRARRLLDPAFKSKFDYAVVLGLKILSKTGLDSENNLRVFLSSACTPKPELVTIISKRPAHMDQTTKGHESYDY